MGGMGRAQGRPGEPVEAGLSRPCPNLNAAQAMGAKNGWKGSAPALRVIAESNPAYAPKAIVHI